MNDIRPRNIGANGIIFDTAIDDFSKGIMWAGTIGIPLKDWVWYIKISMEKKMDKIYFIIILWMLWIIILSYIRDFFNTWIRDFFIPLLISLGTIIYLMISIYIIVVEESLAANFIVILLTILYHFRNRTYDWHKDLVILPFLFFPIFIPVYYVLAIYITLKHILWAKLLMRML